MERVKGEKYWSIVQTKHGFEVCDFVDDFDEWDNADFEIGNRFLTQEEGERIKRLFNAVLKGAEVIEMPSEEEIESVASKICHEIEKYGIVSGHSISGYMTSACKSMADFFNNKIVK